MCNLVPTVRADQQCLSYRFSTNSGQEAKSTFLCLEGPTVPVAWNRPYIYSSVLGKKVHLIRQAQSTVHDHHNRLDGLLLSYKAAKLRNGVEILGSDLASLLVLDQESSRVCMSMWLCDIRHKTIRWNRRHESNIQGKWLRHTIAMITSFNFHQGVVNYDNPKKPIFRVLNKVAMKNKFRRGTQWICFDKNSSFCERMALTKRFVEVREDGMGSLPGHICLRWQGAERMARMKNQTYWNYNWCCVPTNWCCFRRQFTPGLELDLIVMSLTMPRVKIRPGRRRGDCWNISTIDFLCLIIFSLFCFYSFVLFEFMSHAIMQVVDSSSKCSFQVRFGEWPGGIFCSPSGTIRWCTHSPWQSLIVVVHDRMKILMVMVLPREQAKKKHSSQIQPWVLFAVFYSMNLQTRRTFFFIHMQIYMISGFRSVDGCRGGLPGQEMTVICITKYMLWSAWVFESIVTNPHQWCQTYWHVRLFRWNRPYFGPDQGFS